MHYNVAPSLAKDSIQFDSYQKINIGMNFLFSYKQQKAQWHCYFLYTVRTGKFQVPFLYFLYVLQDFFKNYIFLNQGNSPPG